MKNKRLLILIPLILFPLCIHAGTGKADSLVELQQKYQENLETFDRQVSGLRNISDGLGELAGKLKRYRSRFNINRGAQGRWLIYGEAGEKIVRSAARARGSIIILARMFDIQSGPLMKKLAESLVNRANEGVNVKIILSEKFPIDYFHKVNQQAAKYFKGTPVQLEMVEFNGNFNRELEYYSHPRSSSYVNSAVMLVDGVELIGGTYILSHEDLTTGQSNIIQLRGLEVYREVRPSIEAVFDQLGLKWKLTEADVYEALKARKVQWKPVWNFQFYLGVYAPPVLSEIYERACRSLRILTHRPSRSNTRVVSAAVSSAVDTASAVPEKEIFYQERGMGWNWLHITDLLLDAGYDVYKFDEEQTQYHRAGIADDYWFYTGTVELSLAYLQGWNLQSLVTGSSPELGEELSKWLDKRRARAVPIHEQTDRFRINAPAEELSPEQRNARKFLRSKVIPVFKTNNVNALISLLDEASATSVAKRFLFWIEDSDGIDPDYYRPTFKKLGVDVDSPGTGVGQIEAPTGRELLGLVARELILEHPPAERLFAEELSNHLKKILVGKQAPVLVEEKKGYRLHQPELLPINDEFVWTLRIKKVDDRWRIQLLQ